MALWFVVGGLHDDHILLLLLGTRNPVAFSGSLKMYIAAEFNVFNLQ